MEENLLHRVRSGFVASRYGILTSRSHSDLPYSFVAKPLPPQSQEVLEIEDEEEEGTEEEEEYDEGEEEEEEGQGDEEEGPAGNNIPFFSYCVHGC